MKSNGTIPIDFAQLLGVLGSILMLIGVFLPFAASGTGSSNLMTFDDFYDTDQRVSFGFQGYGIPWVLIGISMLCLLFTFLNRILQPVLAILGVIILIVFSFSAISAVSELNKYYGGLTVGIGPFVIFAGCVLSVVSYFLNKHRAESSEKVDSPQ